MGEEHTRTRLCMLTGSLSRVIIEGHISSYDRIDWWMKRSVSTKKIETIKRHWNNGCWRGDIHLFSLIVFPPISILLPGNFPFLLPALSKPSHHFDPHTYSTPSPTGPPILVFSPLSPTCLVPSGFPPQILKIAPSYSKKKKTAPSKTRVPF